MSQTRAAGSVSTAFAVAWRSRSGDPGWLANQSTLRITPNGPKSPMRFPPQLLDEIRARLPVSQVVARRVALRRQGREFIGLSPFKVEKTPSFTVNDHKGFYHCFATGEHGDIFTFLMKTRRPRLPRGGRAARRGGGRRHAEAVPEAYPAGGRVGASSRGLGGRRAVLRGEAANARRPDRPRLSTAAASRQRRLRHSAWAMRRTADRS